jgi:Lon protease-like protein
MSENFEVPKELPAMTLPGVVFFPKSMVPLHIFEPRYRRMLAEVLEGNRMFALLGLDETAGEEVHEPPILTSSAGVIRICRANGDGTSNLVLQGISRIRILDIVSEEPYRVVKVEELSTIVDETKPLTRPALAQLLEENRDLGGEATEEMLEFLKPIEDDVAYVDLAAFTLCKETLRKQRMLETLDLSDRATLLADHFRAENERLRLFKEAMGDFPSENLDAN